MSSLEEMIFRHVELALMEDTGAGDLTTLACIKSEKARAEIVAKSEGILAGLVVVEATFLKLDQNMELTARKEDGEMFKPGEIIITISGNNRAILTGERTALNFLGHLSGIATLTSKFVKKVEGTGAGILDTRKTIPGLRYLEKYAVTCGGGSNHRYGLYDMALIKDNHIAACGSITNAVEQMRVFINSDDYKKKFSISPDEVEIEVEVSTEEQLTEAIECKVKRILLDNRSINQLKEMVKMARRLRGDVVLEASGNVTLDTVRDVAETGVDLISIGALTHSAPSSDFSLKMV